ncbi:MAG TPA: hypothetical protein VFZ61_27125 [Polyangiales bacterium]
MLRVVMRRHPTWIASACALLLAALGSSCSFDPVARPVMPERLDEEPAELLGRLDVRGQYVLLARGDARGGVRVSISRWRKRESCTLPMVPSGPLSAPAERPRGAKGPRLYAPAGLDRGDDGTELVLVDEACGVHEGYGLVKPRSIRTFGSAIDGRPLFTYLDPEDVLHVIDPYASLTPHVVANDVRSVRAGAGGPKLGDDALWLLEGDGLTRRRLDGRRELALGSAVSTFVLHPQGRRVAFIDGEALYEAVAPEFSVKRIAEDACSPRYSGGNLEFFAPCEAQELVRIRLTNGAVQTFEPGVFASSVQDGVQLDYVSGEDDTEQLVAQFHDGARMPITPSFARGKVYVMDEGRLAGLDPERRFGVWQRDDASFRTLLPDVEELRSHHRGKSHSYSWLLHHALDEAGLGTLTVFDERDMRSVQLAHGVPRSGQGGFLMENGDALPDYPFAKPLLVLLEDAQPLPGLPERFRGRLRALAMGGEPSVPLAEGVSSYMLVADPVPGLLYAIDEGEERGLWFAGL